MVAAQAAKERIVKSGSAGQIVPQYAAVTSEIASTNWQGMVRNALWVQDSPISSN